MKKFVAMLTSLIGVFFLVTNCFAFTYAYCTYYTQYQEHHLHHHTCSAVAHTVTFSCFGGKDSWAQSFVNYSTGTPNSICTKTPDDGKFVYRTPANSTHWGYFEGETIDQVCQKIQNLFYQTSAKCAARGVNVPAFKTWFK